MKSSEHGENTSTLEVVNISEHGFWLYCAEAEYFLDYINFPWFKDATVRQISNIQLLNDNHLHWPDLDVDLSFDIIKNPQKYRLISK